jgi:hypothetical protein
LFKEKCNIKEKRSRKWKKKRQGKGKKNQIYNIFWIDLCNQAYKNKDNIRGAQRYTRKKEKSLKKAMRLSNDWR